MYLSSVICPVRALLQWLLSYLLTVCHLFGSAILCPLFGRPWHALHFNFTPRLKEPIELIIALIGHIQRSLSRCARGHWFEGSWEISKGRDPQGLVLRTGRSVNKREVDPGLDVGAATVLNWQYSYAHCHNNFFFNLIAFFSFYQSVCCFVFFLLCIVVCLFHFIASLFSSYFCQITVTMKHIGCIFLVCFG